MKSVKISEGVYIRLVAFKAYLTLKRNKQQTMDDAVRELLDLAGSERYCREVLKEEQ